MNFQNDILPLKDKLFRLALRITMQREEAEDIVQETMIRLWNNREKLEMVDSIEAYAITACRDIAINHLNATRHNVLSIDDTTGREPQTENPYERIYAKESIAQLHAIMAQLPEKQRTCMQLRDFEGHNYRDIADMTGMTEDQVKVNIFRARQYIKRHLTLSD